MSNLKRAMLIVLLQKQYRVSCIDLDHLYISKLEEYFLKIESRRLNFFSFGLGFVYFLTEVRYFLCGFNKVSSISSRDIESFVLGLKVSRIGLFRDYYTYVNSFVTLFYETEVKK